MNEKMKMKMEQILNRSAKGLVRFRMSFFLSLVIFLAIFCRVAYMPAGSSFDELFPVSIGYILVSLGCTVLFSMLWRILLEWKHRVSLLREAIDIPVLAGFYFLWQTMPMNDYFAMYVAGLAFSLPCLCLFFLHKLEIKGLFPHVFVSLAKSFGIALLTMALSGICLLGVDTLLFHVAAGWWHVLWVFSFVLAGVNVFLSYLPYENEHPRSDAFLYLLKRVFLPAYLALMVILYGYIVKILFLWEMPVGRMNWYASFAVAIFSLFYFCLHEETDGTIRRFLKYGALALLPVMAVQALGIYIRFDAYGLTSARYASMVCNVFGFLVILSAFFRRAPHHLFLLAGLLGILCSMTPLNIIDVPVYDQGARLERILIKNEMMNDGKPEPPSSMSDEDAEALRSAYLYLKYSEGAWRYPVVEQMKNDSRFDSLLERGRARAVISMDYRWEFIPVEGYRKMYHFDTYKDDGHGYGEIIIPAEDGERHIDILPYMEKVRQRQGTFSERKGRDPAMEELMTYRVDENRILYFTSVLFPQKESTYFHVTGYMLEK